MESKNLSMERPIYPAEETIDQQVQRIRELDSLAFKDVKQLKEAVMAYGAHAPFTVALLESFAKLTLHPVIRHNFAGSVSQEEIICCGEVICGKIAKRPRSIMPLPAFPSITSTC